MNLDELQSVQSRERQASSLQHLRATFYEDAGEYIGELRRERNQTAAAADDPFDSPEVERLTDDIRTAERTVESIYERRVGKVVKLASIAAADMPYDDDGLTSEEEQLFTELVAAIEQNRECVLSVLDGEAPSLDCTPADQPGSAATTEQPETADPTPPSDPRDGEPSMGAETDPTTGTAPDAASAADGRPTPPDRPATAGEDTSPSTRTHGEDTSPTRGTHGEEPAGAPDDDAGGVEATDDALDIGGAMGGGSPDDGGREPSRRTDPPTTGEARAPDTPETQPPAPESGTPESEMQGSETPTSTTSEDGADDAEDAGPIERTTIRITADVGDIFGVDGRSYDLSAEDVVTLPTPNAEGLVSKDAAERLD